MKTQDEDGYWKDLAERLQAKVAMAESVLDRSTKEVERLRALYSEHRARAVRAEAELKRRDIEDQFRQPSKAEREIERLRTDLDATKDRETKAWQDTLAEVERLRDMVGISDRRAVVAESEVERLRAVLLEEGGQEANWILDENERLRAKVERLENHIRSESSRLVQIDAARDKAEAEVERLRKAASDEAYFRAEAEQEVEQLRAKYDEANVSFHQASDEVERLRAALDKWKRWSAENLPSTAEFEADR